MDSDVGDMDSNQPSLTDANVPEDPQNLNESVSNKFINFNEYKAGLDNLDKERINKIIQEASKNSPYYAHQQNRQKNVDLKIAKYKAVLQNATETERKTAMQAAKLAIAELESERILNRIMVHFDMDMFFAAVEIKKNPKLIDKPVAVGSMQMISTSNYVARRYGVRSAMAGFIAKKLCPQLILIRSNFQDYKRESKNVMEIISKYDPDLKCLSLDEVYIDLTDYVFEKYSRENSVDLLELYQLTKLPDEVWTFAYDEVAQIRARIFAETKLTVSAGISYNTLLSKLCTDMNKPNGQFMLKGDKDETLKVTMDLPIRKFFGIGPVTGQLLNGLDICKGSDIFNHRDDLFILFGEHSAKHFLRTSLGISSSFISNERPQKSYSSERTVGDLNNFSDMCSLLKKNSHHVANDLKRSEQLCRTITIKLKNVNFETCIKSKTINNYTDDEEVILKISKDLLSQEVQKSPSARFRLLGVKVSNFKDKKADKSPSKQLTLTQCFQARSSNSESSERASDTDSSQLFNMNENADKSNKYQCRFCYDVFDNDVESEMHRLQCIENIGDILPEENFDRNESEYSITESEQRSAEDDNDFSAIESNSSVRMEAGPSSEISPYERVNCPACQMSIVFESNYLFNEHLDQCLNKSSLLELTKSSDSPTKVKQTSPVGKTAAKSKRVITSGNKKSKKRKSNDQDDPTQLKIDRFLSKK